MIFKVQITTLTNDEIHPVTKARVLIYDKSRLASYEGPCPEAILSLGLLCNEVQGDYKTAFKFYAHGKIINRQIALEREAPWQDW